MTFQNVKENHCRVQQEAAVGGIKTTVPSEWDQSTCVWSSSFSILLPQIPPLMSQSPRCVQRIKVSVVGIRNNGFKSSRPPADNQSDHLDVVSTPWSRVFSPNPRVLGNATLVGRLVKLAISSKLASLFTPQEYKVAPPKKNPTRPTWEPKTFAAGNAGCGQWINLNTLPTKLTFYPDLQLYQIRILKSASHNLPYPPPSRIWKEKIANMETKIWSEAGSSSIQQKISSTWNWSYSFFKYK